MTDKVFTLIFYNAWQGYPRTLQSVCAEVLRKRPNDAFLKFWRAYGLLLEGSTAEVGAQHRGCNGHIPLSAGASSRVDSSPITHACMCVCARMLLCVCTHVLCVRACHSATLARVLLLLPAMQAMRELNQLVNAPEVELCAAAAMLQVHESAKVVDHDAVMELQNKLEVSRSAGTRSMRPLTDYCMPACCTQRFVLRVQMCHDNCLAAGGGGLS